MGWLASSKSSLSMYWLAQHGDRCRDMQGMDLKDQGGIYFMVVIVTVPSGNLHEDICTVLGLKEYRWPRFL